jgi:hypothetical protein
LGVQAAGTEFGTVAWVTEIVASAAPDEASIVPAATAQVAVSVTSLRTKTPVETVFGPDALRCTLITVLRAVA